MSYSIGEFSRRTGLGIHTLRYYEQEGLLAPARDTGNRRRYSEQDIAWAEFLLRLKATGMPIQGIREYARLRAEGSATLAARRELLFRHRQALREQIAQLQEHACRLDGKIAFYEQEIERNQEMELVPSGVDEEKREG